MTSDADVDISQVMPGLWVGAAIDAFHEETALGQIDVILARGIDVVVDCRADADDAALWQTKGLAAYHSHGIEDSGAPVPDSWFADGVELIYEHWQLRHRGVLVHCEVGANRSPSLVFAVLLIAGLDPTDAAAIITAARPAAGLRYAADALRWYATFTALGPDELAKGILALGNWQEKRASARGWAGGGRQAPI
ncbi:dual specificity protein phosphatase family protein [Mycolicibacterium llatzerense]|uniref:dual specificity protein phosphatase family protein n=1 Tax=Mycolicibacterium llatzerense TaxID=280871 RepID=UPI0008DD9050|nr:dual specificity protein phosphatase family protein [Mycolicibacterium llatzerense]